MYLFTIALHIMCCFALIGVILLQPGKGADVGLAFGGAGGGTIFGPRGAGNLLTKATAAVAVTFMITSIVLALYSNRRLLTDANVDDEIERMQQEDEEATRLRGVPVPEAPESEVPPPEAPTPPPSSP
jgi:preprotein translocase subunit SecG